MAVLNRVREILGEIRHAKFPSAPKRKYDLASEAMAKPFGRSAGQGPIREGGHDRDHDDEDVPKRGVQDQ